MKFPAECPVFEQIEKNPEGAGGFVEAVDIHPAGELWIRHLTNEDCACCKRQSWGLSDLYTLRPVTAAAREMYAVAQRFYRELRGWRP